MAKHPRQHTAPLLPRFAGQTERRKPSGMDRMPITTEQRQWIETQGLEIFAKMSNDGFPLREILAAVFLSGMNLAIVLKKESI